MRGADTKQSSMLCLMSPESRVPANHPLRGIKRIADHVLDDMSSLFDEMYAETGRPSVPPERLLKSMVLMALYTIRSERQFCEQLDYNLLFRWFLGMNMVEDSFDASTFSKNRERLMAHEVAYVFFHSVKAKRRRARRSKTRQRSGSSNPTINFRGQKRRNDTHQSTTDPEARLMRKGNGKEAKLSFSAHALMENRNGMLVDLRIAEASGTAERQVALMMLDDNLPGERRITLGADKGYHTRDFVRDCRDRNVTPHVADKAKHSMIDGRTTRQSGYSISQRVRKRVEEIFGWAKTVGGFRRTRFKGKARTQLAAYVVGAAYNLTRMSRLLAAHQ
jgi:transposase